MKKFPGIKAYKISFNALDGTRIIGYKLLPGAYITGKKIPFLIHAHGYMGNKGLPDRYEHWLKLGIGVLAFDMRNQGGETVDSFKYKSGLPGRLKTLGILDEKEYYLGKLYTDTIRAFFLAKSFKEADINKIIIEGGSQGGGISVALAGILQKDVFAALADVPSYTNMKDRVKDKTGSLSEVAEYIKQFPLNKKRVFQTLEYFDNMNLVRNISCPFICSVGLKDNVCPARNFLPAYAIIESKKELFKYKNAGHEGGGDLHKQVKIRWLKKLL